MPSTISRLSIAQRIAALDASGHRQPAPNDATTAAARGNPTGLLKEFDTPLLHSMRIGYIRVATREALRTAALIREEFEVRGEVLP